MPSEMPGLSRDQRRLLLLCGVGLLARLLLLFALPQGTRVTGDSGEYTEIASGVLSGHGFTRDLSPPYTAYLGRVPTYPLFIAGVWFVTGKSLFALSAAQCLLDALVIALVYWTARARFDERTAFGAGLLYALLPFTIGTAGQLMSESVCAFCLALALYAHTRAVESSRRFAWSALSGLAWGAAILARPYLAPLVPVLGILLAFEASRGSRPWPAAARTVASFGLAVALILAPWVGRNAYVARETRTRFVPLQLFGSRPPFTTMYSPGFLRFMASFEEPFVWTDSFKAPQAHYLTLAERTEAKQLFEAIGRNQGVTTPEMNAAFERITAERYRSAPLRLYVWRPLSMALRAWFSPRTGSFRLSRGTTTLGAPRPMVISFLLLNAAFSLLALLGWGRLALQAKSARSNLAFLVLPPLIATVVIVCVAVRESRLTMPLFPVTCIAAALGAIAVHDAVRSRWARLPLKSPHGRATPSST
jgi:4-amino-4-deoxy-L-arabinose transferase-like glycosyltransferase